MLPAASQIDARGEHTDHDTHGDPQVLGHFCGQRMEANGHLVAERPGLTRNGGGVGGNH